MTDSTPTNDAIIDQLVRWGASRDDLRAMLMTSTRAVPGAKLDAYSDYDIILVVRDTATLHEDRNWLEAFGDVLVAYWDPVPEDDGTGTATSGNVTQYANGLKIDFSCWSVAHLEQIARMPSLPDELDAGYQVLIDKDGLAARLAAPTYTSYIPARPDEATFQLLVNDFFVGPPYVAKCLLRDELLPARWCFDYDMRYVYFLPMLEWRVECDHDWALKTGSLGKGLKPYLSAETWTAFESTFAGAGIEENWNALFRMMALFGQVAREVAASLGYTYPEDLEHRVTEHIRQMREGVFASGPVDRLPG